MGYVCMNLLKELNQCHHEYVELLGGEHRFKYLKNSLLVDRMSIVRNNFDNVFIYFMSTFYHLL